MISSKYQVGDIVDVVYLPKSMHHFTKGRAIVTKVSRNTCQEGTDWEWNYQVVFVRSDGTYLANDTRAWYHNSNFKLVTKNGQHSYKAVWE